MTIKQYQKIAAAVAKQIRDNSGNVDKVRHLRFNCAFEVGARDPKCYKDNPSTFESDNENVVLFFDTISNPNNPNVAFRTLKPGSMSLFNSQTGVNVDASDFNYDSAQFANLLGSILTNGWKIVD